MFYKNNTDLFQYLDTGILKPLQNSDEIFPAVFLRGVNNRQILVIHSEELRKNYKQIHPMEYLVGIFKSNWFLWHINGYNNIPKIKIDEVIIDKLDNEDGNFAYTVKFHLNKDELMLNRLNEIGIISIPIIKSFDSGLNFLTCVFFQNGLRLNSFYFNDIPNLKIHRDQFLNYYLYNEYIHKSIYGDSDD
ncbi:hypothetical protein SMI01S_11550 [Sphingobacterium mizutaii NBRC 14946 = DSM 11724]|uniref:Uncharacterized protein n=2 Tax=Sphingobacterium mizutaii TaxID=1010 RepID=A0AAJ4XCG8_9SPHI|nr:hypothetical protein [Sphingobacterium mizutaii]GEM67549.1 hypothetical protein SMI01S_11550 [Sphingobacterium mizutaii NBRC 14946 = DSM 11724]SDL14029.1 hypothetical protein SAMN05192578_1011489 [Sphingobacterium mizutaii]SNV52057.1 Uncharacterised protein [Sphingobacterium mizutaii]